MRDVTPLRLMSWLSCQLGERSHLLIKEAMKEFSQVEPVHSDKILQIGQFHLPHAVGHLNTWDDMRNAVIDEITVWGRANPPQIVVGLIKSFLQRVPLPRLLHFVDVVLPQMVPVSSPSQSTNVTFPGGQLIRDQWIAKDEGRPDKATNIIVTRLFKSHAGIEHLTVNWNGHPVLLFADMDADEYASVWQYQFAKAVTTLRQNVTMGLKKGNTVLLHFTFHGVQSQAILMMSGSIPGNKGGDTAHKLWKHALPRLTEFAWLPRDLAEAFCPAARPRQAVWYAC